jgi:adenine-specific DNA-methyltransferase
MTRMTDTDFAYIKERHAAARTNAYVFHQLIPYIGNKRKLLGLIQRAIALAGAPPGGTFADLFAGSGVVARMAKQLGFRVLANDWEPYAYEINRCAIACNEPPPFGTLGGYTAAIAQLNALAPHVDWVTRHLCPADDQQFDTAHERLFFTRANGMRIDAIRTQIAAWEQAGWLTPNERAALLAPLLYSASYASNTSGVFKGFHHGWGGQTGTALYRILAPLTLRSAVFFDNGLANEAYCMDATALARQLAADDSLDIAYLDPPYNQHPYGSNYHVLNSLALWDRPALSEHIDGRNKAAIRADWRTERRSAYNYRADAERAYAELLNTLNARAILTSYSTDGMIPLERIVQLCTARGHTQLVQREYKRYRVSSQRFSPKPLNIEFVLITDTAHAHTGPSAEALCAQLRHAEHSALAEHRETLTKE